MTTTMAVAAPQGAETSDHFRKTALFFQRNILGEEGGAIGSGRWQPLSSKLCTPWRYAAETDKRLDLQQHPRSTKKHWRDEEKRGERRSTRKEREKRRESGQRGCQKRLSRIPGV